MKSHATSRRRQGERDRSALMAAPSHDGDAQLERIMHLEQQLAQAPVNSRQRRELTAAIRTEAGAYRKSLDVEQAGARHDPQPWLAVASRSPGSPARQPRWGASPDTTSAPGKPTPARRRATPRRSRSAPRR